MLFSELFEASKLVAQKVSESGGVIALELPKGCDYWNFQEIQEFLVAYGLQSREFDGCAFGLISTFGSNKNARFVGRANASNAAYICLEENGAERGDQ